MRIKVRLKSARILMLGLLAAKLGLSYQKTCFHVEGMVCGKCAEKVEKAFEKEGSVKSTFVSLKNGNVVFESETPLDEKRMIKMFEGLNLKSFKIPCD